MGRKFTKSVRTGEIDEFRGKPIYLYSDGSWRYDGGKMAKPKPGVLKTIKTSEQAREMQTLREDIRHERIVKGALRAIEEGFNPVGTKGDVIEAIAKAQMELAIAPETGRASTEASKFIMAGIGEHIDMRAGAQVTALQVNINISKEATEGVEEEFETLDAIYRELDTEVPF